MADILKVGLDRLKPDTVSARLPRHIYDQLQELKRLSGKSLADVLKEALGRQKPSTEGAYIRGLVAGRKEETL